MLHLTQQRSQSRKRGSKKKKAAVKRKQDGWKATQGRVLPCGSRSVKSSSETSFSSSACISTPKSSRGGDRGAEVQEVELSRASGNGEPGCCGGRGGSSCIGVDEPNNNRKKIKSRFLDFEKRSKPFPLFMQVYSVS